MWISNSPKNPVFVPIGVGLKINLSRVINLDVGYRMNFVAADNLDGLAYWNSPPGYRVRRFIRINLAMALQGLSLP